MRYSDEPRTEMLRRMSSGNRTQRVSRTDGDMYRRDTAKPLAMVYSPLQAWENIYDIEVGFDIGTIFADLDFPFYPTMCKSEGSCRDAR